MHVAAKVSSIRGIGFCVVVPTPGVVAYSIAYVGALPEVVVDLGTWAFGLRPCSLLGVLGLVVNSNNTTTNNSNNNINTMSRLVRQGRVTLQYGFCTERLAVRIPVSVRIVLSYCCACCGLSNN